MADTPTDDPVSKPLRRRRRQWLRAILMIACATMFVVWWTWRGHDARLQGEWIKTFGHRPTKEAVSHAGDASQPQNQNVTVWVFAEDGTGGRSASNYSGVVYIRYGRPHRWWTQHGHLFIEWNQQPSLVERVKSIVRSRYGRFIETIPPQVFAYTVEDEDCIRLEITEEESPPVYLTRINRSQ